MCLVPFTLLRCLVQQQPGSRWIDRCLKVTLKCLPHACMCAYVHVCVCVCVCVREGTRTRYFRNTNLTCLLECEKQEIRTSGIHTVLYCTVR